MVQRSRTSFFNTCIKKNFGFWPINVEIILKTRTRLNSPGYSASFSCLRLFAHLLVKFQNYFLCMCCRRMFCFSDHSPWETNLKAIPFKVVLSWNRGSRDVITGKVYCKIVWKIDLWERLANCYIYHLFQWKLCRYAVCSNFIIKK